MAEIVAASSGRLVPIATINKPTIASDIPRFKARPVAPIRVASDPINNSAIANKRLINIPNLLRSSFSLSSSGSSTPIALSLNIVAKNIKIIAKIINPSHGSII